MQNRIPRSDRSATSPDEVPLQWLAQARDSGGRLSRRALVRGLRLLHLASAHVAETSLTRGLLLPAVPQHLDADAFVAGMVARVVAIRLALDDRVAAGKVELLKVAHFHRTKSFVVRMISNLDVCERV